jgi:hypothetical protein
MLNDMGCTDLIKNIRHDGVGMSLYSKRLDQGKFTAEYDPALEIETLEISWSPGVESGGLSDVGVLEIACDD